MEKETKIHFQTEIDYLVYFKFIYYSIHQT